MTKIVWNNGKDVFYAHLGTSDGCMVAMISVHNSKVMVTYHDGKGWHPAEDMAPLEDAIAFVEKHAC